MLSDRVEVQWNRRRGIRKVHIVAALGALLAAVCVLAIFTGLGRSLGSAKPASQVIADVDLRIGNTILAVEQGEAQARADIEAGSLQLQTFEPLPSSKEADAKARQLKQRYGIAWVHKTGTLTPASEAYANAYNRVAYSEIERRHGRKVLEQLIPKDACGTQGVPCP